VAAEVRERDGLPLQAGELVQRAGQPLAVERVGGGLMSLVPQPGRRGGLLVAGGGGDGTADPVDGAPARDHHRPPGGAALARVEVHGGRPELEEHLLGDLLGLGRVAEHGRDLIVDRLSQLLVNQVERPVLSAGDGAKQRIEVTGRGGRARAPALLPTHERYSKAAAVRLALRRARVFPSKKIVIIDMARAKWHPGGRSGVSARRSRAGVYAAAARDRFINEIYESIAK
jgi:hypothetical protein